MSSGKMCSAPGCSFYASSSGVCSGHEPEAIERTAAARAEAARAAAEEERHLAVAGNLWAAKRPAANGSPKQYLVLGASPAEERRGRTHYTNPNVWLLGDEPRRAGGYNYSRYIRADYSEGRAEELREIAETYANRFDEITFDASSMCSFFSANPMSLRNRFQSFNIMLKPTGVLYLPDFNEAMNDALQMLGFETMKVRVRDLGGDTIVNMIGMQSNAVMLVAIKRPGGAAAEASHNGLYGGTRRRRRTGLRRRGVSLRKVRRNRK
jgi:hypothetical protein